MNTAASSFMYRISAGALLDCTDRFVHLRSWSIVFATGLAPNSGSLTFRFGHYVRPRLLITSEHNHHSHKIEQRRREQADPSECG
jgi:hypothetical protein